jgi:membrane protein YdbS with pleckstrin-like domain
MDREDKIGHISRIPLFSELSRQEIELVERLFRVEQFRTGEYIYRQGEMSFALYAFISGRGRLLRVGPDGIERRGADVDPGEYVGEKSLFLHGERPDSLVILRDATVLVLPRRDFDEFIRRYPTIKARLNVRDDVRSVVLDQDFPWLNRGEMVLHYTHRHKWAYYRRSLFSLPFVMLLPVSLIALASPAPACLSFVGLVVGIALPILITVYSYFDWKNDWFVVTNQRVVHEERILLTFNETREQAPLASIQQVRTSQEGYFAERYGFGDLLISTAGAGGTLVFDTIEDPDSLADIINRELQRTGAHKAAESRDRIREEIDRFLGKRTLNRTRTDDIPQPGGHPSRPPTPPTSVRTRMQERWARLLEYLDVRVRIDEGFRVTYRKHWLVLWNDIFTPSFFFILTLAFLIITLIWHDTWPWNVFHPLVRLLFFLVVFPLEGLWWWYMYEDWHNDLYIIEEQTLTRIHRRPLWLQDEQSTILLRNIQGVNVSIRGFWQKLLNYGTVIIQTAADESAGDGQASGEVRFPYVHQPLALQEDILRRQRKEVEEEKEEDASQMAEQIARWLAIYHQATHPEDFDEQPIRDIDKGEVRDSYYYKSEDD